MQGFSLIIRILRRSTGPIVGLLLVGTCTSWMASYHTAHSLLLHRGFREYRIFFRSGTAQLYVVRRLDPLPDGTGRIVGAQQVAMDAPGNFYRELSFDNSWLRTETTFYLWPPLSTGNWSFVAAGSVGDRDEQFGAIADIYAVPHWVIASGLAAVGAELARRDLLRRRVLRRVIQGRCSACGYDLRESPGRCPECGKFVAESKPIEPVRKA